MLVNQAQNAFVTGTAPGRLGNAHPNIVPYETFATADGEIAVAVGSRAAVAAVLRGARAAGPRRRTRASPRTATASTHRAELRPIIAERLASARAPTGCAALDAAERPVPGRSPTSSTAFASPEAAALGMTVEVEHPALGVIRQVGIPIEFGATPAIDPHRRRRSLGEHTDEILAELGYDADGDRRDSRPSGVV